MKEKLSLSLFLIMSEDFLRFVGVTTEGKEWFLRGEHSLILVSRQGED